MDTAFTPFAKKIQKSHVLAEYPRPQMVRKSYLNLNGLWEYAFTQSNVTPENWDGEILVPFAPESPLSGVNRPLQPDEFLWYQRSFTLSEGFINSRVLLNFGAVDQSCTIYVNDVQAGNHQGGYLPFSIDITKHLRGAKNQLKLVVKDPTNTAPFAMGNQHLSKSGSLHSAQSGIWQTVWLESVPKNHITNLRITPLYDDGEVEFLIETKNPNTPVTVQIFAMSSLAATAQFLSNSPFKVPLPGALSWQPTTPFLYTVLVATPEDKVESYFGMRKIHLEKSESGAAQMMLNNKPFFGLGIVDQGMFSDGLYTPPTDSAIQSDLRYAKACGFNIIRKNGKIEPLRWYYHCDKLGMLVWQDLPSGGKKPEPRGFEKLFKMKKPDDNHYHRFGMELPEARETFMHDMDKASALLYNNPSVVVWGIFQNGVGQFDSAAGAARMKENDNTRLVDATGGWCPQDSGDIQCYSLNPHTDSLLPNHNHASFFHNLGEIGMVVPATKASSKPSSSSPKAFKFCTDCDELVESIYELYREIAGFIDFGLCGFFYNGLSDAEDEVFGLLSYNRQIEKLPPKKLALLNEALLKTAGLA